MSSDFPINNLPAATNRNTDITRKSIQNLGGMNGSGYAPAGGYDKNWNNKIGVRANVMPAHKNGSTVW